MKINGITNSINIAMVNKFHSRERSQSQHNHNHNHRRERTQNVILEIFCDVIFGSKWKILKYSALRFDCSRETAKEIHIKA